jgi:hypothetical protein
VVRLGIPFGLGVPCHSIAYKVNLLPALSPFVSVSLLRAHVANLQMVAPAVGIFLLILDTVPFDSPFPRAFPFHDTTTLIGSEDNDEFTSAS